MQFKASVLAAVAGFALANAQIEIPACGAPCMAKANLSCDPTALSCVCPQLTSLMSNQELITCVLGAGCTMDQVSKFTSDMTSACAKFSAGGAASSAGSAVSSAGSAATSAVGSAAGAVTSTGIPSSIVVAPTMRPTPSAAGNGTGPATNGTAPRPTTPVPGAAARNGVAAVGLGLMAVLAL